MTASEEATSPPFRPARWLGNRHLQTVWPFLFRRRVKAPVSTEVWTAPDGEGLAVHLADGANVGAPAVLVVHGMEGSATSGYVRGVLAAVRAAGWNGAAFDLRSCGALAERLRTRTAYHAGKTDDLAFVVERLRLRWPEAPLALVGFSLGGNMILKYLGETGTAAPVVAGVAVSVPYDLAACTAAFDGPGFWNAVYRGRFLVSLRRKALRMAAEAPGRLDARAIATCKTIFGFDDAVTARIFGFAGAADYYQRSSAAGFLAAVRRPTLLMASVDDPFIPASTIPHEIIAQNPQLRLWLTDSGGHVGFLGGSPWRPQYVADQVIVDFLRARFAGEQGQR